MHPTRAMFDAMATAMAKVPGARMFVASTAGSPNHWSFDLWKHANASELWYVQETRETAPWADEAQLADMRLHLPASVLARQIENRWVQGDESMFTTEELEACIDYDRAPADHGDGNSDYVMGVDLGLKHDRTAIVVVRKGGKKPHRVEYVWLRTGTPSSPVQVAEVEAKIAEIRHRFNGARVLVDPYQMVGTAQRMGLTEFAFTSQSVAMMSSKLLGLIREGRLRLLPDPALRDELLSLVVKDTSYGWRMLASPGAHDDLVMALAVAALEADKATTPMWAMVYEHGGGGRFYDVTHGDRSDRARGGADDWFGPGWSDF